MTLENIIIREGTKEDCKQILNLIQELADYEKMPDAPKLSTIMLEEDGFGKHQYFKCFVAESSVIIGYALYYFTYSTWEGKSVYMEDLYVTPDFREKGIGTALVKKVAQVALDKNCIRLNFSVLNWNTPSIEFYKSKGAFDLTQKEGWHFFRIEKNQLEELASTDK